MQETMLNPGWDTLLVAVPFVVLLAMSIFRLDEVIAAPKRGRIQRRTGGTDIDGNPILCDPDGRPSWRAETAK